MGTIATIRPQQPHRDREMEVTSHSLLRSVKLITPKRYADHRGFFSETWREEAVREGGLPVHFVQDNHSLSRDAGTVRGLHFQIGETAQRKLVRCIRGSILDVVVDVRHGSPTFGRHAAVVLSEENWCQLFIPTGFAHGYCTLQPDTEVLYKVSSYYDPKAERGLAWDDPKLKIEWPVTGESAIMTARDRRFPTLAELPEFFRYTGHPD
jgi:dTDP-4-dehydrorhamnose 3,5-epimerase